MNFNTGSRLIFILFLAIIVALFTFLIIIFVQNNKKKEVKKSLKILALVFAVLTLAGCFICPLTYFGDIPINLRYGTYQAYDGYIGYVGSVQVLKVHRDSISLYRDGSSAGTSGYYTLKNDILEIKYGDGTMQRFVVKHLGSELVDESTNIKAFHYIGD